MFLLLLLNIFFQAEDGIRDQPRSRGLGDVYKRQVRIINAVPQGLVSVLQAKVREEGGNNA